MRKSVPEQHAEKIAQDTLRMPDAIADVMGGAPRPTVVVWKATEFHYSDGAHISNGKGGTILVSGMGARADNLFLARRIAAELNGDAARTCPVCDTTWYPGDFQ